MKNYKAILFDFDGVVGKTMEDNYDAWAYAFLRHNIKLDKDEYYLLEGRNTRSVAEILLKKYCLDLTLVEKTVELKEDYYRKNNSFSFYEGVKSLIVELRENGFLIGLVSGASRKRLTDSGIEEFLNSVEVVITGDEVTECKPAPEPYLKAAGKLCLSTADCLVIENAPLGIEAARSAGMDCIAVCSTLDSRFLAGANIIIDRIADLKAVLGLVPA